MDERESQFIRACIEKVGKRLIFADDYSLCDHSTEGLRRVCFHRPKPEQITGKFNRLKEGNTVIIEYQREKTIAGLPLMLVGIKNIEVIAKDADPDFLLDL